MEALTIITVTLITPPPELVLRFGLMEGGGVSIINDGGGGRPGSAARSTSSTSKRKSNKIADISGRNNMLKSLRLSPPTQRRRNRESLNPKP